MVTPKICGYVMKRREMSPVEMLRRDNALELVFEQQSGPGIVFDRVREGSGAILYSISYRPRLECARVRGAAEAGGVLSLGPQRKSSACSEKEVIGTDEAKLTD